MAEIVWGVFFAAVLLAFFGGMLALGVWITFRLLACAKACYRTPRRDSLFGLCLGLGLTLWERRGRPKKQGESA